MIASGLQSLGRGHGQGPLSRPKPRTIITAKLLCELGDTAEDKKDFGVIIDGA